MADDEIMLRVYDADDDGLVGDVKVTLVERADGWYMTVVLAVGEPRTVVQGAFAGKTREEALDAAVLKANDVANEAGHFAEL